MCFDLRHLYFMRTSIPVTLIHIGIVL